MDFCDVGDVLCLATVDTGLIPVGFDDIEWAIREFVLDDGVEEGRGGEI